MTIHKFNPDSLGFTPGDQEIDIVGEYGDVIVDEGSTVDLIDSANQLLTFRVGEVFHGDQPSTKGLWVDFQERYLNSSVIGNLMISPKVFMALAARLLARFLHAGVNVQFFFDELKEQLGMYINDVRLYIEEQESDLVNGEDSDEDDYNEFLTWKKKRTDCITSLQNVLSSIENL